MTVAAIVHLLLHVAVPALAAAIFFRGQWLRAFLLMMATMVVDIDHLLATPIYNPGRCSIGFHPLHTLPAIAVYAVLTLPKATRLIGIGLLIHMALDVIDCGVMRW